MTTGYGVIELHGHALVHVTHGCIRSAGVAFPERLGMIYAGIAAVMAAEMPDEIAVEKVFMNRNVEAALKLGQARGAALAAVLQQGRPVVEFAATAVKSALVGRGHADKAQVGYMVQHLLKLATPPPEDAADALAVAICHAHQRTLKVRLGTTAAGPRRRTSRRSGLRSLVLDGDTP